MAAHQPRIDAQPGHARALARNRRAGLLGWIVLLQAIAADSRLLSWTLVVSCGVVVVEIALARLRRSPAALVLSHFALACIACAHASVCLSAFDVGLTLGACAIALGASAVLVFAQGLRRATLYCCVIAGACALLCAIELALPPCIAWPGTVRSDPFERWSDDLFSPDPELGWVMQKNATVEDEAHLDPELVEWRATYHTDEKGGRVVPGRPVGGPAVLLFGCSFAFGHGLNDQQTIAAELQRTLPHARVFDYGALAYGTAQSWLALQRCPEPAADQVVYLFIDDHLRRDDADRGWLRQFPNAPLFELDASSRLERIPSGPLAYVGRRLGWSLWKRSFVFRRLDGLIAIRPDDEHDVLRAAAFIGAMQAEVRSKWGAACRFVTLFVPQADEQRMSARSRALHDLLQQRAVECTNGFAEADWTDAGTADRAGASGFDRTTGHPRPALAARIASWIARAVQPATAAAH